MRDNSENVFEFTLIYNKYKQNVYNYVLKMVNDRMYCEDIVQTVFVKFFENMKNIINDDSYHFYIFKTARNEVYNYYRKKKNRFAGEDPHDEESVNLKSENSTIETVENAELKNILDEILESLPAEQKEVFVLKEYNGLSYKEIAAVTGTGEDLVKSRLYKTRQKIIKRMTGYIYEKRN